MTNEELIKSYHELKKELGKTPTMKEYDDKYHKRGTIYRRFGSWNNFVINYCNDIPVQRHYTNEKCIVSSCDEKAKVKGYCQRHYIQMLNNGKITREFKHNQIEEKGNSLVQALPVWWATYILRNKINKSICIIIIPQD